MNGIIDRAVLLVISVICGAAYLEDKIIYLVLVGVVAAGLFYFCADKKAHTLILSVLCISIVISDIYLPLILLVVYETAYKTMCREKTALYIAVATVALNIMLFIADGKEMVLAALSGNYFFAIYALVGLVLSIYLAYMSYYHVFHKAELVRIRDDNEEARRLMIQKNILLKEKQDNEIMMATMNERNRIARDIHDNVGHLLSRSIVQMGALQTIYKEEPLASNLKMVSATLNESMNNIRNSVHNLHNEALDMNKSVLELCGKHERFEYEIEYDVEQDMSKEIKYCFIAILQEAIGNAEKHSDATAITIIIREHPVFYQMIINDNGHPKGISESGIGLHNMEARIKELNGQIFFSVDRGFRIFVTVPKSKE